MKSLVESLFHIIISDVVQSLNKYVLNINIVKTHFWNIKKKYLLLLVTYVFLFV